MSANLRPDPHGYLIIAYGNGDGEYIAKYLYVKRYRIILWFNDLNDDEEPPKYRLVVSSRWLEKGVEKHDYKQLREFIAEWERLYSREIRYVDFTDERERIDPGPSPLEKMLLEMRTDLTILDDLEDITK
jgi:hypothetical protein